MLEIMDTVGRVTGIDFEPELHDLVDMVASAGAAVGASRA